MKIKKEFYDEVVEGFRTLMVKSLQDGLLNTFSQASAALVEFCNTFTVESSQEPVNDEPTYVDIGANCYVVSIDRRDYDDIYYKCLTHGSMKLYTPKIKGVQLAIWTPDDSNQGKELLKNAGFVEVQSFTQIK